MSFLKWILAKLQKKQPPTQEEIDSISSIAASKLEKVKHFLSKAKDSFDSSIRKQNLLNAEAEVAEIQELMSQHSFLKITELYAIKATIISLEKENPRKLELRQLSKNIGSAEQACPYCSTPLAKMPQRKTKCKSCSEFVYPRKEPLSSEKRLFKESELPVYEELKALAENSWESWRENQEQLKIEQQKRETIKQGLASEWGVSVSSVSDSDVEWRLIHDEISIALKIKDWPTYLSLREESIRLLNRERKYEQALRLIPECIYLTYAAPDMLELAGLAEYSLINFEKKTYPPLMSLYLSIEKDIHNIKQAYERYAQGNNLLKAFELSADDAWGKFEKDYMEHPNQ